MTLTLSASLASMARRGGWPLLRSSTIAVVAVVCFGLAALSNAFVLPAHMGRSTPSRLVQLGGGRSRLPPLQQPRSRGALPIAAGSSPAAGRRKPISLGLPTTSSAPMPNVPLPMVDICANGEVIRYQSTLTSIRSLGGAKRLTTRDIRLLRSSTPVLADRPGYIIFDLGDLRGILQHDRLTLIGADRPAVTALGAEVQRRLELDRAMERAPGREDSPFEVRALECMLEQVYSVLEDTLQRLSVLVSRTLAELTSSDAAQSEGRREAALGRLLPLRISLSSLQARSRRISQLLDELLEEDDDLQGLCLTHLRKVSLSGGIDERLLRSLSIDADEEADADAEENAAMLAAEEEANAADAAVELVETLLDVYDARLNSLADRIEQVWKAEGGGSRARACPLHARRAPRPVPTRPRAAPSHPSLPHSPPSLPHPPPPPLPFHSSPTTSRTLRTCSSLPSTTSATASRASSSASRWRGSRSARAPPSRATSA